jgi:hypothetical protein
MANRHQLVGSLFLVEIFKKFPVIGLGDQFGSTASATTQSSET